MADMNADAIIERVLDEGVYAGALGITPRAMPLTAALVAEHKAVADVIYWHRPHGDDCLCVYCNLHAAHAAVTAIIEGSETP
jgi:hypothetical protein